MGVSPFVSRDEEEFWSFESTYEPRSHRRETMVEHAEEVLFRVLVQQLYPQLLSVMPCTGKAKIQRGQREKEAAHC